DEGASGANGVLECTNGGQPADPEIGPAQPTDLEGSPAQPNSHESGQNCSTLANAICTAECVAIALGCDGLIGETGAGAVVCAAWGIYCAKACDRKIPECK